MISRPSLMATGQRKIEDLFVYGIARPTGGHRAVNFRLNAPSALMYGIVKRLPGVLACDQVDFDVRRGKVHALLGENGAGKSTVMRILYGLHQPDEGRILRDGAEELGLLLAGVYPEKQKGREQERNSLAGRRGRLLEPLNGSPSNTLVSKRRGLARPLSDKLASADQQRQDEHNTHHCPRMSNSYETVSSDSDGSRHILSEAAYRPLSSGLKVGICIPKNLGAHAQHKQLPVRILDMARFCLALATLSVQIAAIVNTSLGLPHRYLSDIATAFQ